MPIPEQPGDVAELAPDERLYFRDRLRAARYAALADAEGFGEICFAIEALGIRVRGLRQTMGKYKRWIFPYWQQRPSLDQLAHSFPALFGRFEALYDAVQNARNDAMHTGAYARHVTAAAIELCIGLEDTLMSTPPRNSVADFMVKSPIVVESWQPVAHARQLMLTHSFSYLPTYIENRWQLISEMAIARFLRSVGDPSLLLAMQISDACKTEDDDGNPVHLVDRPHALALTLPRLVEAVDAVAPLLVADTVTDRPSLWLVRSQDPKQLSGVLSPFELM
jgi:hypothetical protein